jgi:tetratricopeptide (TPR) repeat protein
VTLPNDDRRPKLIALVEEKQDEESFQEAKRFLEDALAKGEDAELLRQYGYIHECRGGGLMREALRWYERSIHLDPSAENAAHGQLIIAHARLLQVSDAIDLYKARLAAAPENVTEYRYLAQAYLLGGEHEEAGKVVEAGLAIDANDRQLLEARGSVLEAEGRYEDALTTWKRAFELDQEASISPRFNRVFLLQRLDRLEEAAAEWEAIIEWLAERDYSIEAEWPKRELARVRALLGGRD